MGPAEPVGPQVIEQAIRDIRLDGEHRMPRERDDRRYP
jgi:hypothetical protein